MAPLMTDRMLKGLAQRLRLIGYDCAQAPEDARSAVAVLKRARAEGRMLVTTALRWHDLKSREDLIIVPPEGMAEQAKTVMRRAAIDFDALAFTRCSIDNVPLEFLPYEEAESQLPPLVREMHPDPVSRCPLCGRLYWRGTHVERVWRELQEWKEGLGLEK